MKNKIFFAVILCSQVLFSQRLSHPLRADSEISRVSISSASFPDTLNVLAILVQFQQDNDSRTSGNGLFDLTVSEERIVDAPPHDSAYIADHFVFAQNYFSKASNGKQNIKTVVLGRIITLKKQMKDYAPISGNLPLAHMIEESWIAADSLYPGFPFQQYDMFAIFHAGVGRDIDLRAALGFDPTPLDIPSLYFSLNSFKSVFENPGYQGISLVNSSFKIPNSVVLPETEVRRIPSIGGDFVLKLGINGLLVASIGSHLGLPDLFDTKTGKSGIGRFGLMDGQSIFSFSGICPPEPSAWEKIYLGWTSPIEVFGNKSLILPAVGLHGTGNDTIFKIPISAKEYYLVENRQRDVNDDGQSLLMKWKGQIFLRTFLKDENFFSNTNIDSAFGVILDADELDWSLPGLINANNNYKGGILVWHIDETIIEKNLATNSINTDPDKRGVDLEEADGSQDIGQTYDFGDPASGSEDGSPIDYWFSGNIFPNYKNEFSENTNPNSLSNTLAKSHITLKNFSLQLPRMTFEANIGDANIRLVKVIKRNNLKLDNNDAPIAADLNGDGKEELIYTSGDSIYVLKDDLTPYLNNATGLFLAKGGRFQPAFYSSTLSGNPFARGLAGVSDSTMYLITPNDINLDGQADLFASFNVGDLISTSVSVRDVAPRGQFIVGTVKGKYIIVDSIVNVDQKMYSAIVSVNSAVYASSDSINITGVLHKLSGPLQFIGQINTNIIVTLSGSSVSLFDLPTKRFVRKFDLPSSPTSLLSIADINGDNIGDIILGCGNKLYVFNINGTVIENFPFKVLEKDVIVGSTIIANDKLIFGTMDGHIYSISNKGVTTQGFPLQSSGTVSAPFLANKYLMVSSTDSSVYFWEHNNLFSLSNMIWKTFLGSESHNSSVNFSGPVIQKSSELLPKKFAYNWPNPVYSGSTNIRYFLGKSANVKIKIVNLAGELVDELQGTNFVGLDNEVSWNISNIQSGIYFAQITASGSGEEASRIVKIAVVK